MSRPGLLSKWKPLPSNYSVGKPMPRVRVDLSMRPQVAEKPMPSGRHHPTGPGSSSKKGLQACRITPLKALAVEIQQATQRMSTTFDPNWKVDLRTGDTSAIIEVNNAKPNLAWSPPQKAYTCFWVVKTIKNILPTCAVLSLMNGMN